MKNINYRILDSEFVNFRAIEKEGVRYFEGYASVFNHRSKPIMENGKLFYEVIDAKAFDEVLASKPDTYLTFNHSRDKVMARTTSGTMELSTDEYGLKFRASVPDVSYANDAYALVQRGDLFENSFAFIVRKGDDEWSVDEQGNNIRTVKRVSRLIDVSIVTAGAYSDTVISAREDERGKTITITISDDEPEDEPTEPEEELKEPILTDDPDKEPEEDGCKKKRELERMQMYVQLLKLKN